MYKASKRPAVYVMVASWYFLQTAEETSELANSSSQLEPLVAAMAMMARRL